MIPIHIASAFVIGADPAMGRAGAEGYFFAPSTGLLIASMSTNP